MDVRRNYSRVGQRPNFAYSLQVADDAVQMDVHNTLYSFYHISLCWLNLNSQSFVWNVFYTTAISNAFLFINYLLPNIHFFKHFLRISHNLRIIKVHNNVSGEKTLSQNFFKQCEVEMYVDKTIGQVTKVRTPRSLKKAEQLNYENSRQQI